MRIALSVLLLLAGLAAVVMWPNARERAATPAAHAQVVRESITSAIPATGVVASLTRVDISAPLAGRLIAVHAQSGARVEAGQVLARLDDREARALHAKAAALVELRQRELALAQSTLARQARSAGAGFVSPQHLEDARTQRDVSLAQLGVAQADLQLARTRLEDLAIRAPVSGLVAESNAQVGEWTGRIDATAIFNPKVLFRIIDPDLLVIHARIDEADLAEIALGQPVQIDSEGLRRSGLTGRVDAISPVMHEHNGRRVALVQVGLDDAAHGLRDGGQVDLRIVTQRAEDVLTLPFGAIRRTAPGVAELQVLRNGQPMRLQVRTGLESLTRVEILSDALDAGDTVVLAADAAGAAADAPR